MLFDTQIKDKEVSSLLLLPSLKYAGEKVFL